MYNPINYMPGLDLLKVHGLENAKSYPTKANSRICLFEDDDDVFYILETDSNNFKSSIRRFRFAEEPIETEYDNRYVSKEEFNSLKEMIGNVQQSIQQLTEFNRPDKQQSKSGGKQT